MGESLVFSTNFLRGIHLSVTLIGFVFIILTWLRYKDKGENQNWGIALLALSLLSWAIIELFKIAGNALPFQFNFQTIITLSLLGNTFIIAALPFFKHGFEGIKKNTILFNNKLLWAFGALLFSVFIVSLLSVFWSEENQTVQTISDYFDITYSFITIVCLAYVVTISLYKRNYGRGFVILSLIIFGVVIFTQIGFWPDSILSNTYNLLFTISISRLALIFLLAIFAQSWAMEQSNIQTINNEKKKDEKILALSSELGSLKQSLNNKSVPPLLPSSNSQGTYLKFYKNEKALVVELTIIDKGIIKATIYSSLNREFKDLLKFAVHKKRGKEIKALSGMHRDFGGDIYKSISDIRKRFINPALKDLGYQELKTNELIIQKIRGTGIYELDCHPNSIELDTASLSEIAELETILQPIPPTT